MDIFNKSFIISILTCLSYIDVLSVPAYPHKIVTNEGVEIFVRGDENTKWGETLDGYTLLSTADGWFYAEQKDGVLVPSAYMLSACKGNDPTFVSFLDSLPKGLKIDSFSNQSDNNNIHRIIHSAPQRSIVQGDRHVLVILIQYQDVKFVKSLDDFYRLFNQENYDEDGAMGSVKDFYDWASYGKLNLMCDIVGPFTASHNMDYYGGNAGPSKNDKNPYELFKEAIGFASLTVDLNDYDSDCDGYIDNVHIIFAGYGEEAGASANAIWSHEMTFPAIIVQDVKIDRYSCAPELRGNKGHGISRIGPHCHEIGHALGAMDFYDVDYETNGNFSGTGQWDVMASGSWNNDGACPPDFNPYVKHHNFGWVDYNTLKNCSWNTILNSQDTDDQFYMLPTEVPGDYFMLQYREKKGFDRYIPGEGLVIFHIGPDIESRARSNNINSKYPQQCYVVCASANSAKPNNSPDSYGNINSEWCVYPCKKNDNNSFSETSIPGAYAVNGSPSGIMLSDIHFDDSGSIVLFNGTKPVPTVIWSENFENSDMGKWIVSDNSGWSLYKKGAVKPLSINNINTQPEPSAGSSYLYSKISQLSIGPSTVRTHRIATKDIVISDQYDLSLKFDCYISELSQDLIHNTLNVYLCVDSVWQLIGQYEAQNKWIKGVEVPIGTIEPGTISIAFESCGVTSGYCGIDELYLLGSILETDGVEYTHHEETPSIRVYMGKIYLSTVTDIDFAIYTLSGIQVTSGHLGGLEDYEYKLSPGIYILRAGSHTFKIRV